MKSDGSSSTWFAASLVGRERTICETEAGDVRITQT